MAVELAVECYGVTKPFPAVEAYGLTSQIRRSSASIAANIAEGYGRETTGSFVQSLRVAQGSLKELETHVIIASKVGLINKAQLESLLTLGEELGKMLRSMIRKLQQKP